MKPFQLLLTFLFTLSLYACVQAKAPSNNSLAAKQDSLMALLKRVENQTAFIAKRMGWEPPEDTLPKDIPLGHSYYQGAKKPLLTIVEFTSFSCPYCAQIAPDLDSLARTYPNKVRIVFKHFPLSNHPTAMGAHVASLAAGKQGRFYDFRYKLAPKFRSLNETTFLEVAAELGLDMDTFKADMALNSDSRAYINEDLKLGNELGVHGTPTVFVNGRKALDRSFRGLEQLLKSLE